MWVTPISGLHNNSHSLTHTVALSTHRHKLSVHKFPAKQSSADDFISLWSSVRPCGRQQLTLTTDHRSECRPEDNRNLNNVFYFLRAFKLKELEISRGLEEIKTVWV